MEEEKRISEEELKKDVAAAEARIRKTDDFTSPEELYGELIASVKKYHPSDDISLIEKAYHDRRRADRGVRPGGVPDCKRCHEAGTAEIFCG